MLRNRVKAVDVARKAHINQEEALFSEVNRIVQEAKYEAGRLNDSFQVGIVDFEEGDLRVVLHPYHMIEIILYPELEIVKCMEDMELNNDDVKVLSLIAERLFEAGRKEDE